MGYKELIKYVQLESGFSSMESEEALTHTVESIAERLSADERKDFASELPPELQQVAMAAQMTSPQDDIIEDFMETYNLAENHAKKRLLAAWHALKQAISQVEIRHIQAQLPKSTLQMLR